MTPGFSLRFDEDMRVLGIDPGSRVTGFGVVDVDASGRLLHVSHGIIRLQIEGGFPARLGQLGTELAELLIKYAPKCCVVEKIFLGKNADSAFKLGHARGVVLYEVQRQGVLLAEYATRLVKQGVAGSGSASKVDVEKALGRWLNIAEIRHLDASDALALAVFHALRSESQRAVRMDL